MPSQLKLPDCFFSVTAQGAHFFGYNGAQSFDTPKINNHSVAVLIPQICLGDDDSQYFENILKNNQGVTEPSAQILLGSDSLQDQNKNITHKPGQKISPPGK